MLMMLYPRNHRREYGEAMLQLFRDQCRDAQRDSASVFVIWRRVLLDLIFTAIHEHLSNLTDHMKTLSINKLTHLLFAAAIGFALLTSPTVSGPHLATVFAYLSTLTILARGIAEWFRPPNEWLKAIGWGCVVLVAYGFIMPFWAKLHVMYGDAFPTIPALLLGAIFLNLIVPLLKAMLVRMGRVKS
jgi:hypothetical protein